MNINREVVIKRFKKLDILLGELEKTKNIQKEEFLKNITLQLSVQRALVLSINICIDIGAHILSSNKSGAPETYAQIFENMEQLNLINIEMKDKLIELVQFRNLLGHLYMKINDERVFEIIQRDLRIFKEFKNLIFLKFKDQLKNQT